jgi:hypothetical protein
MFLRAYLSKLCTDPSRMEFWEYLDKVGYAKPLFSFPPSFNYSTIISYYKQYTDPS